MKLNSCEVTRIYRRTCITESVRGTTQQVVIFSKWYSARVIFNKYHLLTSDSIIDKGIMDT